jgi:hypothetical protein
MVKSTFMMLALAFATSIATAADDPKIDQLRKEVAELKSRLAVKEAELAKLDPVKEVAYLNGTLTVGTAGRFGVATSRTIVTPDGKAVKVGGIETATVKVSKVIDANKAILTNVGVANGVIARNFPTKDIADGATIGPSQYFRVVGTEKYNGRTFFVVEPYTPRKP